MKELLFKDARDYILLEYQLRKSRRSGYSMRAFARDLKFSPSSLNDFLKDRVGMSESRISQLSQMLNWSKKRSDYFKDLVFAKHAKDPTIKNMSKMRIQLELKEARTYISADQFELLNKWYNYVMIEIFEMNQQMSPKEIAISLHLTTAEVNQAIKNLLKSGSIEQTENGYKPTQSLRQGGDDKPSDAIKNLHHQILEQAQIAIYQKPMEERESHSLIFSIRDADKEKMNSEIRKALYAIVNKYAVDIMPDSTQIISLQSFQIYKNNSNPSV